MTLAGWWYLLISLPVMRFLALRWLWRMMLWAWVLWRVSRLDLQPRPAHPDRAGGLAFLGGTQAAFGVFVFAFGVQLSCLIADAVHFRGAELTAFRGEVIAFVVIVVIGSCFRSWSSRQSWCGPARKICSFSAAARTAAPGIS